MEGDRTWQEQMDAFMQSELAETVVPLGMETAFTGDFDNWLRSLNLDRWEGDSRFGEYLEDRLERFLEHQLDAGHLDPPHLGEVGGEPVLWDTLYGIAEVALEARYTADVARGVREDMRAPSTHEHTIEPREESRSLTERVQDVMQMITDFVRGREAPERSDELGR